MFYLPSLICVELSKSRTFKTSKKILVCKKFVFTTKLVKPNNEGSH